MAQYGRTWWGEQWLKALDRIDFANRLPRGRTYANKGMVTSIKIIGNGLSAGVTFGIKPPLSQTLRIELNSQIGYGHYYNMTDNTGNLPTGNYLDARIALWLGFRF